MAPQSREAHQASQSIIADTLGAALKLLWPELDLRNIDKTKPSFFTAVLAMVRHYGNASSVAAAANYRQQRIAANVPGTFRVPLPTPPPAEQVAPQLNWAISDLYGPTTPEKTDAALTKVQGVAEKIVLDQGRTTTLDAVKKDPRARAWARVPEPGACSFCLMLATRGAVYKTKETAGPNKRGERNEREGLAFLGDGKFKVHDHCRCDVEPLFGLSYEMTATVRAAEALYIKSARSGPSDPLNNFRVALQRERDAGRFAG